MRSKLTKLVIDETRSLLVRKLIQFSKHCIPYLVSNKLAVINSENHLNFSSHQKT